MAVGQTNSNPEVSHTESDAQLTSICHKIEKLADKLKGECSKYPKEGRGLVRAKKHRYLAVKPAGTDSGDIAAGTRNDLVEKRLWQFGCLAWWSDKPSYDKKDTPKGSVPLMKITKVVWERDHPLLVVVKHKLDGETCELTLQFKEDKRAEEWCRCLHQLRNLIEIQP